MTRRRWIPVLAGVVGATIVLTVAGAIVFSRTGLPVLVAAYDFTDAIESGHTAQAYRQLCASEQRAAGDPGGFGRDVRARLAGGRPIEALFVRPFTLDLGRRRSTVQVGIDPRGGTTRDLTLQLVRRHGDWHPCGFS